jgi:hypothetical protein
MDTALSALDLLVDTIERKILILVFLVGSLLISIVQTQIIFGSTLDFIDSACKEDKASKSKKPDSFESGSYMAVRQGFEP